MKVKQSQFDQLVNDALNHVITEFEDGESIHFIHDQLATAHSNILVETDSINHNVTKKIKHWSSKVDSSDTNGITNSFEYDISSDEDGKGFAMKISVNGNTQTIDIQQKLEKLETIIENDSFIISDDEKIVFSNRFGNMMIKMAKEFKDIEKPVQHLLGSINIDSVLTKNLEDNGITAPFDYAIYHDDELVEQFSSKNFDPEGMVYKVSLFRHNLFDKSALLALNFNGTRHYILRSMGWMLILSIFFTLFIIITFASTLHYMFKQKKIADIKNDFINNMTHEFKTPISTISLAIDSITHPKIIDDKEQINYYADIIRKENKRMNQQVESVLNTSLAEKEELTIEQNSIDLNEFLSKIEQRVELPVSTTNTSFEIVNNVGDITFNGDENHLQNSICNLIDNAIKYSEQKPIVKLEINKNEHYLQFAVSDKGVGMNKETQKLIFDKFYRAQTGNIHNVKGFGIGLSYVKAIVNAHGGQISLNSKPNQGTVISINLPL
jgi:signal transduction histidine kinase